MYGNKSIKLKAAILLIIFSMNTVIGLACSVGVDFRFNATHHQDEEEVAGASVHVHANGNKHHHESKATGHQNKHKGDNCKSKEDTDNCCNDKVPKFSQLDKAIPHSFAIIPIFFTAFISSFYNLDILVCSQATKSTKYFVRGHHPPIPDILIASQRFQI
ncbi:MAG: hypothetical protein ABIT96_10525 [Ferruginibacter sp.]